jgi:hypothetical protein
MCLASRAAEHLALPQVAPCIWMHTDRQTDRQTDRHREIDIDI